MSSNTLFPSKQKKLLLEKIHTLSSTEHEEIFNIIQRISENASITYTSNKNGIFFNLSTLSDDILREIDVFVNFCHSNKKNLDEYEKQLQECKVCNNIVNVNLEDIVEKKTLGRTHAALPIIDWSISAIESSIDPKNVQKVTHFIEKVYIDKTIKKKMNVKFHNARKKYSKKIISDSKFDNDIIGDLTEEEYIFK